MDKTVKMDCQVHQDRLDLQALRDQRDRQVNLYRLFHLPEQVVIAQMVELNLLQQMEQLRLHATELDLLVQRDQQAHLELQEQLAQLDCKAFLEFRENLAVAEVADLELDSAQAHCRSAHAMTL
jgi:hypothetical protein